MIFIAELNTVLAQQLEKVWVANEGLKTPESVIYDQERNVIYVSNINGDPTANDDNGYISILKPDGTVKNAEWKKSLNAHKELSI